MLRLYFTQLSVNYLAQVILTLFFTLYIVWLYIHSTRRADSTRFLMLGMTGFFLGRLFYKSLPLHTAWQVYALIFRHGSKLNFSSLHFSQLWAWQRHAPKCKDHFIENEPCRNAPKNYSSMACLTIGMAWRR